MFIDATFLSASQKVKLCNNKQTKNLNGLLQAKNDLFWFISDDDDVNSTITGARLISSN